MQNQINRSKKDYAVILFVLSAFMLSVRAMFGYSFNDEPFIVSLAQRLYYGADLIVDEWNTTQNFGVLILPLYKLYIALIGSTDGILLTFRILYCVMWAAVCTAVYSLIRKKYSGGFWVFCYLILFSPLDQMTLSYTSVSLSCCLLISGLFFYHLEVKPVSLPTFAVLYTVLSVIAVISLPYLAMIYGLNALLSVIVYLRKRNETTCFFLKGNLLSCLLTAAAALLYLYRFVLRQTPLTDVLENLGYIFAPGYSEDPSFLYKSLRFFWWFLKNYPFYAMLTGMSFVLLHTPFIRKDPKRKYGLFLVDAAAFLLEIGKLAVECHSPLFNQQMTPIVYLGVMAFLLLEHKKEYLTLFVSFVVYGVLFAFMFFHASDTGASAISMGMSQCGVAAIVFIVALGKECKQYFAEVHTNGDTAGSEEKKRMPAFAKMMAWTFVCVLCAQLSLQTLLKVERHYWDVPIRRMNCTISAGAARGLRTNENEKTLYEERNESLNKLLQNVNMQKVQDIRFLSMVSAPVLYLDAELPASGFSTWTFMEDDVLLDNLNLYYSVNPSQKPNVIFCMTEDTRISGLDMDLSDFYYFSDGQYSILISPEYLYTAVS